MKTSIHRRMLKAIGIKNQRLAFADCRDLVTARQYLDRAARQLKLALRRETREQAAEWAT